MKKLLLLTTIALGLRILPGHAQTFHPDPTIIASLEAINRDIWTPFSDSWKTGDVEQYLSLHSTEFIRCSGGQQAEVKNLAEYATRNREQFKRNKETGTQPRIEFRFIERAVKAGMASERGIYHYSAKNSKGESWEGYGKFHVVERLEEGRWKILVDYDSNEGGTIGKDDWDAAFAPDDWRVLNPEAAFSLEAVKIHIDKANAGYVERFRTDIPTYYQERYTTDACIMADNMPRICGIENIRDFYFNKGENKNFGLRIDALEVSGGADAVIEDGTFEFLGADGALLDKGKFIATWAREDGKWKLRREIWNSDLKD